MRGELIRDGKSIATIRLVRQRPARFLSIISRPDGWQLLQGYDGTQSWSQLVRGREVKSIALDSANADALRREAPIESPLAFPFLFQATWSWCDEEHPWNPSDSGVPPCVEARFPDGTMISYTLDPETFLIAETVSVRSDAGGNPIAAEASFRDYRTIDGIVIPFVTAQSDMEGTVTEVRLQSVRTNDDYADVYFAPRPLSAPKVGN